MNRKVGMAMKKITKKVRRRLTFVTVAIFLCIVTIVTTVFSDLCEYLKNRNEITILTAEYNNLLKEEESLQSEITKLQDSDYVARYAREKFMYSLPDEVIIKLPEE